MDKGSPLDGIRERIFGVVGIGSLVLAPSACTQRGTGETSVQSTMTSTGGELGASGSSLTSTDGNSRGSSGRETGSHGDDVDSTPPIFLDLPSDSAPDLPVPPYGGPPPEGCPPDHAAPPESAKAPMSCTPPEGAPGQVACFDAPPGGCEELDPRCILATYTCGYTEMGSEITCGPFVHDLGECCYLVTGICVVGRPFIVDGTARLATPRRGAGWGHALVPRLDDLDAPTRAALAHAWSQEGLHEHASVASFSRFILQLLALGAPAELVERAQRALCEEIEHARVSFGLASAYAGAPVEPGPLDVSGGLDAGLEPSTVAASLAAEGCIAETVAAALVAASAQRSQDAVVREVLSRVADQELEHAALAWRTLAWMLERADAKGRASVCRVFAEPELHVGLRAFTPLAGNPSRMAEHGYLPSAERERIAATTLLDVVIPAAQAVLSGVHPSPLQGAGSASSTLPET